MIVTLFPPQKLGDHKELAEWLDRVYLRPFALEDSQMAPFGAFWRLSSGRAVGHVVCGVDLGADSRGFHWEWSLQELPGAGAVQVM